MNREIKFRALSLCRGESWVYGDLRHYSHNPQNEKWTIYDPKTRIETDIDQDTIGQFTGLHDINGNEIYEGDILKVDDVFKIIWYNPMSRFAAVDRNNCLWYNIIADDAKYWEVIGNIHENKLEDFK